MTPKGGVILTPKARGLGMTPPGEPILTLVPQAGLKAEINVPNNDIGFEKTASRPRCASMPSPAPATANLRAW